MISGAINWAGCKITVMISLGDLFDMLPSYHVSLAETKLKIGQTTGVRIVSESRRIGVNLNQ